jgi:hypothetical protein
MHVQSCPICRGEAEVRAEKFEDSRTVNCAQCGKFRTSRTAITVLGATQDPQRGTIILPRRSSLRGQGNRRSSAIFERTHGTHNSPQTTADRKISPQQR